MDDGHGGRGGQRGTWPWAWRVEPAGPESLIAPGFGFDEETQVKVKDDRGAFSRGREAEASLSLALSTSADGGQVSPAGPGWRTVSGVRDRCPRRCPIALVGSDQADGSFLRTFLGRQEEAGGGGDEG